MKIYVHYWDSDSDNDIKERMRKLSLSDLESDNNYRFQQQRFIPSFFF